MSSFLHAILEALLVAFGMFWKVGWSLVLGFAISAMLQAVVSKDAMRRTLGRDGLKEVVLASLAGAASSSCSYASASISRTLFKKGSALIPSLVFMMASTNLVAELGIVLYLLMGWQFTAGEWLGGIVLIAIMALIVKATYPAKLVEEARHHPEQGGGHDHGDAAGESEGVWAKLRERATWILVAQNFAMDWGMLWKDLALGFLIAGALSVFVPNGVWQTLFVQGASPWVQVPANALLGPLVGILSFVCSIGNVPMAAVLWGAGVSFGGVLAFLYSDLIVLPLLDVYRRYYGLKMSAYIGIVFYAAMVISAILIDVIFTASGWVPQRNPQSEAQMTHFAIDYTFWLNILFGGVAVCLFVMARRQPMQHSHCEHHASGRQHPGHDPSEHHHDGH